MYNSLFSDLDSLQSYISKQSKRRNMIHLSTHTWQLEHIGVVLHSINTTKVMYFHPAKGGEKINFKSTSRYRNLVNIIVMTSRPEIVKSPILRKLLINLGRWTLTHIFSKWFLPYSSLTVLYYILKINILCISINYYDSESFTLFHTLIGYHEKWSRKYYS